MSTRPLIDLTTWESVAELAPEGDRAGFMAELVRLLDGVAAKIIDDLRSALAAGDKEKLRQLAHKLKGSCASLGAAIMAELLETIEADATAGRVPKDAAVVDRLQETYERTRAEFAALCRAA